MDFLFSCFKGIAIGAGAILPGISSGVLCVIFGIYEKLLNSILGFFKDIKKNTKFLFPILLGCGIGVLLFSNLLNYLFYSFPLQTKSIFIGLILGSIPSLIKEVSRHQKFKLKYLLCFFIALIIGVGSVILEKYLQIFNFHDLSFSYLLLSGFLMSIGIVVPGVSSTIILMLLGVYSSYLDSVSSLYFPILIPIGIGLIIGGIIFMKLTKYLLDYFYAPTFYSIIGFTFGSIFVLMPEISSFLDVLLFAFCTILGILILSVKK